MPRSNSLIDDLNDVQPVKPTDEAPAVQKTAKPKRRRKRKPWADRTKKKWVYFPEDMIKPANAKAEEDGYRGLSSVVVILVSKWLSGEIKLDEQPEVGER